MTTTPGETQRGYLWKCYRRDGHGSNIIGNKVIILPQLSVKNPVSTNSAALRAPIHEMWVFDASQPQLFPVSQMFQPLRTEEYYVPKVRAEGAVSNRVPSSSREPPFVLVDDLIHGKLVAAP